MGFIAAVLRQMDHAANLVVAFFRSVGMMGSHAPSLPDLPREFLLELAALLQVREWHAAGLIDWFDPLDIDAAVDAFATFLCRHRDAGEAKEVI